MKNNICTFLFFYTIAFSPIFYTGCKKAEDVKSITKVKPEKTLLNAEYRTINTIHLHKDTVYIINVTQGSFERIAGQELIIEEGTVIKINGQGAITISPGGILNAKGTAVNPIVFTSNERVGLQGKNWGGLTIQGKSFNNSAGTSGIADDNSGVLNYVRVEFAPLTLNALGSKTIIENVMVSYVNNGNAAFNIYGGTFNARNLISYASGGPADFYITNGYTGKMQNVLAYRHPFFGNSGGNPGNTLAGLYIKNNENNNVTLKPFTHPIISNLTVLGPNAQNGSAIKYADTSIQNAAFVATANAFFTIRNSVLLGFPSGGLYVNDSLSAVNLINGKAEIRNSFFHSNNNKRVFYLNPRAYTPYNSDSLSLFMHQGNFKNKVFLTAANFNLQDPFNYDTPNPVPADNSVLLSSADFTGAFSDPFFIPVSYIGALGKDNWLTGWVNFTPLKTNYNFY